MTTFPDTHKDLLEAPIASLTTIGSDGFPQSTLVWFIHDDGQLKLSLNGARLKTKNLIKRPQISLLIPDFTNPQRYIDVRGTAVVGADEGGTLAKQVGAKYNADLSTRDRPGEQRLAITIDPKSVYAVDLSR
jgi:PPOX class probable F420-dependent enzyme